MKWVCGIAVLLLVSSVLSDEYSEKRQEMVETQIISRGITDAKTIDAMLAVPRHLFVPEDLRDQSYADYPLPIGYGQTISQPYVVALMTSSLELEGNERVLEIGTGSGYQAAVLAEITDSVFTVEIIPELAQRAEKTLHELGYTHVMVKNADGYFGWEEYQPYDAIMITAAVDHIPPPLIQQLKEGGRLILPLGNPLYYQTLTLVEKREGQLYTKHILDVRFVPMTGFTQEREKEPESVEEKKEIEKVKEVEENITEKSEKEQKEKELIFGFILILCLVVVILGIRKKIRT